MHACSTGSLVVFSPPIANAAQEAFWYVAYAAILWLLVAALAASQGAFLGMPHQDAGEKH
jgi:hypothetical protein